MPKVITFRQPVLRDAGVLNVRVARLILDLEENVVKIIVKETDANGVFVNGGKTDSVIRTGAEATAVLNAYSTILNSLPAQLISGGGLPGEADIRDV